MAGVGVESHIAEVRSSTDDAGLGRLADERDGFVDRPVEDERVGVKQKDVLAGCVLAGLIVSAGEAEVALGDDQANLRVLFRRVGRRDRLGRAVF